MRKNTCSNSAASWFEVKTRCSVWQPTHSVRKAFCLSAPGRLSSHSPFEIWGTRFLTLLSLRSAVPMVPAGRAARFGATGFKPPGAGQKGCFARPVCAAREVLAPLAPCVPPLLEAPPPSSAAPPRPPHSPPSSREYARRGGPSCPRPPPPPPASTARASQTCLRCTANLPTIIHWCRRLSRDFVGRESALRPGVTVR